MASVNEGKFINFLIGPSANVNGYTPVGGEILVTNDTKKFYVCEGTTKLQMEAFHADAATKVDNTLTINVGGNALWEAYNGSAPRTVNFTGSNNVSVSKSGNNITISGPTALKNPQALSFANSNSTYDGSNAITLTPEMLGLGNAMYFRGVVKADPTLATSNKANVTLTDNTAITCASGDVVFYGGNEYIFDGTNWHEMGSEGSHALKSIQISGDGVYITGGGTLASDVQLKHATYTITPPTTGTGYVVSGLTINGGGHTTAWTTKNIFDDMSTLTLAVDLSNTDPDSTADSVVYKPNAAKTFKIYKMKGASASAAGLGGLVPTPAKGATTRVLTADGEWSTIQGPDATGALGLYINGLNIYNTGVINVAKGSANGTIKLTKGTTAGSSSDGSDITIYTLPAATTSVIGGVKVATNSNITLGDGGAISISGNNVRTAMGAASVTEAGG